MSHWNLRVIRRKFIHADGEEELSYGIYETFYNDKNEVVGFSEEPDGVMSETAEGLKEVLQWYAKALEQPILEYDMKLASRDELNAELVALDVAIDDIDDFDDIDNIDKPSG